MKGFNDIIFRFTADVRLRYFQYKIINNVLFLNKQLFKMKIVNCENCSFCGKETEDIVHFLYKCKFSQEIWSKTMGWIFDCSQICVIFSMENILFGFQEQRNDALNCILIVIKYQLFWFKLNGKLPSFEMVKQKVIQYHNDEKYVFNVSGKQEKFHKKWLMLQALFS